MPSPPFVRFIGFDGAIVSAYPSERRVPRRRRAVIGVRYGRPGCSTVAVNRALAQRSMEARYLPLPLQQDAVGVGSRVLENVDLVRHPCRAAERIREYGHLEGTVPSLEDAVDVELFAALSG